MFDYICYADDGLFGIPGEKELIEANINSELENMNDCLKINKLSLNMNEIKFISIDIVLIEYVRIEFQFLGIALQ